MWLVGAAARFPEQRGAENADYSEVDGEADGECPDGPKKRWHHSVVQEPRPPRCHVCDHTLHLEVGPHHSADVEELVAVAEVVEAPRGQPLREVGGKQKTSEEGEEEVVTVIGQGAGWTAASTAAQKNPVNQRDGVKNKWDDKCYGPKGFTSLWELQLQEPGIAGQAGAEHRVSDGNGNKMLMKPSVYPTLWHDVVSVAYGTS